ncbi:NACHT domain-containing protein [Streptomyces decoyicus]|uniref:NACHT domain-containing protein n=1 Tax=Streptomyces decoyicus TaxID=249567 RepID=UPI0038690469|nr:NACHT domain-containing protein [Streptomyces decoyicus]
MQASRTRRAAVVYLVLWATGAALALWLFEDRRAITTIALVTAVPGGFLTWVGFYASRIEAAADTDAKTKTLAAVVGVAEARQRAQLVGAGAHRIDLTFTYQPEPFNGAAGAAPHGRLTDVVTYYRKLRPARLVINGEPGAGKTLLALDLLLGLLTHPDRQDADPVPVRFSLASWDTARPLQEWLTEQVHDQFADRGISLADAQQLVEEHLILPVLDGLDEMDTVTTPAAHRRATRALQQLNAYQASAGNAPVIVTCRTAQYTELASLDMRMRQAARIELNPVTPHQAATYLTNRSDNPIRWSSVLNALTNAPVAALAHALSTPWRLNLAATTYEERDQSTLDYLRQPDQLLTFASADDVRDHLLAHYIPAAMSQHPTQANRYRPDKTHRWLAALANHLATNSAGAGTDLVLHELWSMVGTRRVRIFDALLALFPVAGLLVAAGWVLAHDPSHLLSGSPLWFVTSTALIGVFVVLQASRSSLPVPKRVRLRELRPAALRNQTKELMARSPGALVSALVSALVVVSTSTLVFGLAVGLVFGLLSVLALVLAGVVVFGLTQTLTSDSAPTGPRFPVREDLVCGLMVGLVCGLTLGLAAGAANGFVGGLRSVASGLVIGLVFGLVFGLVIGLYVWGGAGRRYLVFLCCARRRLPWKLGSFLHWAYGAGLIRISGVAYQFRHRELQDWLTAHSSP